MSEFSNLTATVTTPVNKKKKGASMSSEEFISGLNEQNTQREAEEFINNHLYGPRSDSTANSYKPAIPPTWNIFYNLLMVELKFGITKHFASSYLLMSLMMPRLCNLWYTKTNGVDHRWASMDDFLTACFLWFSKYLEPCVDEKGKVCGFDPNINPNILPFADQGFLARLKDVTKPECSEYLQKRYGLTFNSLEALMENKENPTQVPDVETCVEEFILSRLEPEALSPSSNVIIRETVYSPDMSMRDKLEQLMAIKEMGYTSEEILDAIREWNEQTGVTAEDLLQAMEAYQKNAI